MFHSLESAVNKLGTEVSENISGRHRVTGYDDPAAYTYITHKSSSKYKVLWNYYRVERPHDLRKKE